ncbi:MAG: hypothetical protein SFU27_02985 [Thermonemataceae bacterium]|nr:hypothetical protein [Thermonemataceae bacterium]
MRNYIYIFFALVLSACKVTPEIDIDDTGTFYKMYGEALDEVAYDVAETQEGGFLVAGSAKELYLDTITGSEEEREVSYLTKTDKLGNLIWKKKYKGQAIKSIAKANDGWYLGIDTLVVLDNYDYLLTKIDNEGNELWTKKLPATLGVNEKVKKVLFVENEIFLLGNVENKISDDITLNSIYGFRLDAEGNILSVISYGLAQIPTQSTAASKRPTYLGNIIIDTFSEAKYLVFTGSTLKQGDSKLDALLGVLERSSALPVDAPFFEEVNDDVGEDVQLTRDKGYIICGTTNSFGNGGKDIYLLKLNISRDNVGRPEDINETSIAWEKTLGGGGDDQGKSVYPTTDGGYLVLGNIATSTSGIDIYLAKLDASGNMLWEKFFGGDRNDQAKIVKELSNGDILIFGTINFENNDMLTLIRTNKLGELVQ